MGTLTKPQPRKKVAVREAGGDNEVERDGLGRPRIVVPCDSKICVEGKIPSEKREGKFNQCPRCKGTTKRTVSYTRVTTHIDALEDKEALMTWASRMVLLGIAKDTGFLKGVLDGDPEEKDFKDMLNRRAEAAKELAGASDKADKGTFLHGLSELVDVGEPLPEDIDPDDYLDIMSYHEATQPILKIVLMEQLMVNDFYRTAGTPDRVSHVLEGVVLTSPCREHDDCTTECPERHTFTPDELIITDLKTGRVDYGALKMAMQLALYSRSKRYDKATGERIEVPNINQDWGIIMHTPAGGGQTTLYWADLRMGWRAVALATLVRESRSKGRKALIQFQAA